METVGQTKLWSFAERGEKAIPIACTAVRKSNAREVLSYLELARKVAELQFMNRDLVLMFRGQPADYRNKAGNTSLKPTIFRAKGGGKVPTDAALSMRYQTLGVAEVDLLAGYRSGNSPGAQRLLRQQILRWAILQHYEVCGTPLLDVTHSLRIAASFASLELPEDGYVMVIGVPQLSGAVTASADAGLQIIRLSSVCPPSAVRPHIQEGYLLGEYPEMTNADQKLNYKHYEIDFGRRLVAKFRFKPREFWMASRDFPQVSKAALYPSQDALLKITETIKAKLKETA